MQKCVLVIDDSAPVARALRRTLTASGYQVEIAHDGESGLELLERAAPHLVICDFRMPGMSGADVLLQVKERAPRVGRILMSGYADASLSSTLAQAEADDFVAKPWNDDELLATIARVLARGNDEPR
jgi:DNA-binding NtrC family response regulator